MIVMRIKILPIIPRITSYNVCYTKLLRLLEKIERDESKHVYMSLICVVKCEGYHEGGVSNTGNYLRKMGVW